MRPTISFSIKVVYLSLIVIAFLAIVVFSLLYKFDFNYTVRDIVAFLTGGVAIITLLYHANTLQRRSDILERQTKALENQEIAIKNQITAIQNQERILKDQIGVRKEEVKTRINHYSFNVVARFNNPSMAQIIGVIRRIKKDRPELIKHENVNKLIEYFKERPEERSNLALLLNYFEHIALLVKREHVDEDIIKDCFKTLFISTYDMLKFFIEKCQEEKQSSKRVWNDFSQLAQKWSKE